jgi:hypothetical protein
VASRSLGTLTLDLIARIGGFERGMDAAERKADSVARNIERKQREMAKRIDAAWATAFRAIGAGVALGATVFAGMTRSALQSADAIKDLSEATGASIENISALDDLARRTGTNLDTVGGVLVKFNQALADGDTNKGVGQVLKALNLDINELRKLDPAEALRQTAVALSGYADDGTKARAVQELFGKSIREAAPLLKDLAEAGELNATMTRQQAEEFDKLNKQIFAAQADIAKLSRTLIGDMVPSILAVIRQLQAGREAFGGFFSAAANIGTSRTFDNNLDALKFYREELTRVEKAQSALANETSGFFKGFGQENLGKEAEKLRKFVDYYQRLLGLNKGAAGGGRGFVNPVTQEVLPAITGVRPTARSGPRAARQEIDEVAKALDELEQELALFGQNDSFQKAFKLDGLGASVEQLETYRVKLAELDRLKAADEIQKTVEALEKERNELGLNSEQLLVQQLALKGATGEQIQYALSVLKTTDAIRDQQERQSEVKRLYEQTRTPAEQLAAEIERINKALNFGKDDWDLYSRAIFDAQDRFDSATNGIQEETKGVNDIANELGLTFTSAFEDAIVGGKGLRDLLKGLEQDILRIVTRKLVTEPLGNAITGILGPLTSGGDFFGNIFKSIFSGFFADGGFIGPGQWGIAGEEGPEPVFGGRTGMTVQPSSSGRPINVTIHQSFSPGTSRATVDQAAAASGRAVQRAIARGTS